MNWITKHEVLYDSGLIVLLLFLISLLRKIPRFIRAS